VQKAVGKHGEIRWCRARKADGGRQVPPSFF
jgi:hypothetical protein